MQELWRRRDEADRDLIASLRAAAGLPTQEEIFSISPFSDDEDDVPSAIKSEHGRGKFSLKNLADFSPKKTKESTKKSSNKKHVKKKGFQSALGIKMEANVEDSHNMPSEGLHQSGHDSFSSPITGSLSPTAKICSTNEQGVLKDQFMDDVTYNKEDRKKPVMQFKTKTNDNAGSEDVGKVASKPKTMKGTKLVIHLGGRNKTMTNSPKSDSSSYQREQEVLTLSGKSSACVRRLV